MPDLHNAIAAYADEETVDTDFVHHLVRGSELLQAGDPAAARDMLERALRLRPRNQRGQNLLALTYFKLGLFDRAEELYRALVAENPEDATLRVNLGLVHLKTGRSADAISVFESALSISPSHPKAQNYLGLAFLQKKDYGRAKEWFDRAGNASMSARMAMMLAREPAQPSSGPPTAPFGSAEITEPRIPRGWEVPRQSEATPGSVGAAVSAAMAAGGEGGEGVPEPEAQHPAPRPAPVVTDLLTFTAACRMAPAEATPFAVSSALVVVAVKGEVFSRVDGLVAQFGTLEFKPELKRFRGRVTDKPFGSAGRRMMRVTGEGRLWVAPAGRCFTAVEIADEPVYLREDALYAFEESVLFENGRVPSKVSPDLHLVHLRSRGRILLASRHAPRAVDLARGDVCRVPLDALLGWHGGIAPRIVSLADEAAPDGSPLASVDLSGEGRVLLDVAP